MPGESDDNVRSRGGLSRSLTNDEMQEALTPITPKLRAYVERRIPSKLKGSLVADDVLQDVLMLIFDNKDSFQDFGNDSLDRWAMVITQRHLVNLIKAENCERRGGKAVIVTERSGHLNSAVNLFGAIFASDKTPSSAVATTEAFDHMRVALAGLPPDRRRVVSMYYLEERSYQQIADELGKTESAVRSMIFHALQQMRERMGSRSRFLTGELKQQLRKKG